MSFFTCSDPITCDLDGGYMNVEIGSEPTVATRVWYDGQSDLLCTEIAGIVRSLPFNKIPDADFESLSPVVSFSLANEGAVVACRHRDGKDTWLPVDMWLPGGGTP
jgi:hypothetical protein